MTFIWPLKVIKFQRFWAKLRGHIYIYMCFLLNLAENSIALIWPFNVIQVKCHMVNWKTIYDPSEMIMNCSWMVLEQFMCSSWTLIHEQFMNYPWTWNGQVHEVGEVHELGVHKFEFMNLWVHELFMNYSSWIVHELLVHDLFMNNF